MAAVTALVQDFFISTTDATATTGTQRRALVTFALWNNGTAVAGGTDTLDVDVATELAARSNYALSAIRSYQVTQPLRNGATSTEYAATVGISSTTLQLTPKASADWSTNATIPSTASLASPGQPYLLSVLCDVS